MRDATRQAERLLAIRLRTSINVHLEDRGLIGPTQIGAALGLPAALPDLDLGASGAEGR